MSAVIFELICLIPTCIFASAIGGMFLAPYTSQGVIVIVPLAVCAVLTAVRHFKKYGIPALAGAAAVSAAVLILAVPSEHRSETLKSLLWLYILIGASVVCFAAVMLAVKYEAVRITAACIVFISLVVNMVTGLPFALEGFTPFENDARLFTVMGYLICLIVLADEVQLHWKKSGFTDRTVHLVSVIPFIAVCMLITYAIPAPNEPYDWHISKRIWKVIDEQFTKLWNELPWVRDDGANLIGFSADGSIGGDIESEPKEELAVSSSERSTLRVYLSGRIFDTFDGHEWDCFSEETQNDRTMDVIETYSAALSVPGYVASDFASMSTVNVTLKDMKTSYVFAPSKTVYPDKALEHLRIYTEGSNLRFTKRMGMDTEYAIRYQMLNRRPELMELLINTERTDDEQRWANAMRSAMLDSGEGLGFSELASYRDRIKATFLPEGSNAVSDRVRVLLDSLYEGSVSDYDRMLRLEEYLRTTVYNKRPGELPESIASAGDFLDHFLFEKNEGYCTHCATAFVLLARASGLPARYVQGYTFVTKGLSKYIITSNYAHAWPEVYFEGVGWISFEPSPGDYTTVTVWKTMKEKQAEWSAMTSYINAQSSMHHDEPVPESIPGSTEEQREETEGKDTVLYVLIPAGIFVLFAAASVVIIRIAAWRRYESMTPEQQTLVIGKRYIKRLKKQGHPMENGETLAEYAARVAKYVSPSDMVIFEYMEKVLYDPDATVSKRERRMLEKL